MIQSNVRVAARQGFDAAGTERLPLPAREAMTDTQRLAAEAIIAGPRKTISGPFVPLLQCPALMERIGKTGEALRFGGILPERIRELVICVVARETSNQFEWQTHASKALEAGIAKGAIDALAAGRRPRGLTPEEEAATDFVSELLQRQGVSDLTYGEAVHRFGAPGTVELTALVGYFVMVCGHECGPHARHRRLARSPAWSIAGLGPICDARPDHTCGQIRVLHSRERLGRAKAGPEQLRQRAGGPEATRIPHQHVRAASAALSGRAPSPS